MTKIIASLDEVEKVAKYLIDTLYENAIVFLRGDLAAGKTTLTASIVKEMGIDAVASSPTFSLQNCYGDALFHYDLYRITHDEFMSLGLFEEFEKSGWHLVEWGSDELKSFLEAVGYNVVTVNIEPKSNSRIYRIEF